MAHEARVSVAARMSQRAFSRIVRFSLWGVVLLLAAVALALNATDSARLAWADEATSADVSLSQDAPSANETFSVSGMLPGDTEAKNTLVEVRYHDQLTVWFQLILKEETGSLADALRVRVVDTATGNVVCEGTVRELDTRGAMAIPLDASDAGLTKLSWRVEASLPTATGNEHQATRCVLDLHWFIEDEGGDEPDPMPPTPPAIDPNQPTPPATPDRPSSTDDEGVLSLLGGALWPLTGDRIWTFLAVLLVLAAIGLVVALVSARKRRGRRQGEGKKPAARGKVVALGALVVAVVLVGTAWALTRSHALLPDHTFETGTVSIDLNGGEPVFDGNVPMEPGRTLIEDFTVTNTGSASCYFRVYVRNLSGALAPSLDVTISDKETGSVLYDGAMADLESKVACVVADTLEPGQTQVLTAVVHMGEAAGNGSQTADVAFDLCADATQVRNNEGREF